ncbi:MAG TPA: hypothetical protein VHX38_14135 [Pseudonocardiaceae bacterium]|jgi:hypothetical protein|nr:hypothetical protein [Pseudonocardiaceae bacterium]
MTRSPRIEDVIDYLRAHGWAVTSSWRNATVWSWREFDVLVPPQDVMADTVTRLRELVRCVADAEGRSPRGVGREMAMPSVDVVSYRAEDLAGSVALPDGIRAVRAARDLIAACAREALGEPRPTPDGRTPEAVGALLDRSLMSLSEEAFGIDIALPIEEDRTDPLGRRTALRVLHSSTVVLSAARSADPEAFEEVFRAGISEEVCVALSDLAGQDRRSPFELDFHWSRLAPLADEAVRFPSGAGARIRAGSRRVGQVAETAVGVVEGPVTRLSDDEEGERWRIGVRGVLDVDGTATGRQRLVTVWLRDARDYEAALLAHREGRLVRVAGTITRTRGTRGITAAEAGFIVTDRTRT